MGKITKQQLSPSLLEYINSNKGGGSISFKKNSLVIPEATNIVNIGIEGYNKNRDLLMVYKNTVYLEETIMYTVSSDSNYINNPNGNWDANTLFNFIVIKNAGSDNNGNGNNNIPNSRNGNFEIPDGTISESKLEQNLKEKLNEVNSLGSTVSSLTSQLDTINNSNKKFKKANRKFRPNISMSPWTVDISTDGTITQVPLDTLKSQIDLWVSLGLNNYPLVILIGYDTNTNDFFIANDLDNLKQMINYGIKKGYVPEAIRMLGVGINESIINNYGVSRFYRRWLQFIDTLANNFKQYTTIKYFTVLNEVAWLYGNSTHEQFCIDCLNKAKSYKFKTGITTMGAAELYNALENVKINSDCLFINHYQEISNKSTRTNMQDGIDAWDSSQIHDYIKYFKNKYNKDIIISESGCQDNWVALTSPGLSRWNTVIKSGEPVAIYINGLLNSLKNSDIKSVWLWYSVNYTKTKKIISEYLGGEVYE